MRFNLLKTTKSQAKWWVNRKIDWKKEYVDTYNHPHRNVLAGVLKNLPWLSLIEVGCGGGANLINLVINFPGRQLGGIDVAPEAIKAAEKALKGAQLRVGSGENIMMSDDTADIVLTDMCLIYVGPTKIGKYIEEMKRIGRNHLVLLEFHSTSWWKRLKLKLRTGYNAYDYEKLLRKHGFYDIITLKLPKKAWPGEPQNTYAYIIISKIHKR